LVTFLTTAGDPCSVRLPSEAYIHDAVIGSTKGSELSEAGKPGIMAGLTVRPEHFSSALAPDVARELFKASVGLVEIETFSYCNRVCWFCPNSKIDRRSTNRYMDENLYLKILYDLASINYDRDVTYSRYNEPLSDRIILTRIRQARALLPAAHLYTHTNGDYLNRKLLDELRDAGLNRLRVQVYLGNNDRFSDTAVLTRMAQRMGDLGLPFEFTDVRQNAFYAARVRYPGMEVTFESANFDLHGVDRGQTIELTTKHQRVSPCLVVFQNIYIDYNGSVVPCCHIRSDEPTHRAYIVDTLTTENSIFEAYANSPLVEWRKSLFSFGEKEKPCNTCSYMLLADTPEMRDTVQSIKKNLRVS
jgi:radical SAM protein with 4Fe4S-binding SPASM domain